MAFDDRLQYLLLGMAIGFVLGYLVRLVNELQREVREVKEELDEVDDIVKRGLGPGDVRNSRGTNQGGFMRYPVVANIAVLLVVGLTAYAAFVSQKASNDSQASQDRIETVTFCNLKVTTEALNALNERTTYTKAQADSNISLQTDFASFLNLLLHRPPFPQKKQFDASREFQGSLNNFVEVAKKAKKKAVDNPFPTADDLRQCITEGKKTEGEQ